MSRDLDQGCRGYGEEGDKRDTEAVALSEVSQKENPELDNNR